ncbi:solute carrier family 49 member 4-like isoform X1 [Haliotis rufescens]|uniref:solute carrier family 49 member 4-like isoform X1 n=1 Tax=Haliotis rufescens TaxID=6454 RepID=UPI00201EF158|nr:solute carrier family 49 member 4-like isoform X1 [Haliotis rufescens]XP_046357433.2 solute carrier family 49 member 4-like isoform X1 [Haliotis rufescens]
MAEDLRKPLLRSASINDGDNVEGLPNYSSINAVDAVHEDAVTFSNTRIATPKFNDNILGSSKDIQSNEEVTIDSELKVKLYKRRWYILAIYSLFAGSQGLVWNTWGPISQSCEEAFGWKNADISLLTNWGPISYIVAAVFFSWMIDVKGLRWACLSSMFLVAAGCGLRIITSTPPLVTWLNHVGLFLNGLAGPAAMSGPPVVSALWFAPHERTTSTALCYALTVGLQSLSFIIGPLLVPEKAQPNCTIGNQSVAFGVDLPNYNFNEFELFDNNSCSNASKAARVTKERKDIMFLLYIEFGWSMAVLLAMLLYFPKKPAIPPCVSASMKRESFRKGLIELMKRGDFWIVCFVYGLALGVCNVWTGVIDVNLKPHGIHQKEAGWIGFYGTVSGCLGSLIMARFADIFSKHMKWIILILYMLGGGFFVWFALICQGIAPSSTAMLYVAVIGGVTTLNSAVPLLFEMSCELTYPIGEGTTNGILTLMNNIGGLVFLFVLMAPSIGTMWMNWTIIGVIGVCVPVLFLLKDTYNRLELDEANTEAS